MGVEKRPQGVQRETHSPHPGPAPKEVRSPAIESRGPVGRVAGAEGGGSSGGSRAAGGGGEVRAPAPRDRCAALCCGAHGLGGLLFWEAAAAAAGRAGSCAPPPPSLASADADVG